MFQILPVLIAVLSVLSGGTANWSASTLPSFTPAPAQVVSTSNNILSLKPTADTSSNELADIDLQPMSKLDRYVNLASQKLDPRMQGAFEDIKGSSRRLLALKYYSRQRGDISSRWSLNANQIEKFNVSKQHLMAVAQVRQIQKAFAEQNPGYYLKVTTDVRTIEEQVSLWNSFPSVGQAGESLRSVAARLLKDSTRFPENPTEAQLQAFTSQVRGTGVSPTPTAAVPGFSLHGSGRAFDFIIRRISDDQIVAGADATTTGSVWDRPGWTAKLHKAVASVSTRFDGPLRGPYEPWHYNYRP